MAHRFYGRRMLLSLSSHPDFDKILEKYIPTKDLLTVRDTVFTLKTKVLCFQYSIGISIEGFIAPVPTDCLGGGLLGSWWDASRQPVSQGKTLPPRKWYSQSLISHQGATEPHQQVLQPSTTTVPSTSNSPFLNRCVIWTPLICFVGCSYNNILVCCVICRDSSSHYTCRAPTQSIADKTEYIKQISGLLSSKDFRERIKGIDQLAGDCQHNPNMVINSIFPVSRMIYTLSLCAFPLVVTYHHSSL